MIYLRFGFKSTQVLHRAHKARCASISLQSGSLLKYCTRSSSDFLVLVIVALLADQVVIMGAPSVLSDEAMEAPRLLIGFVRMAEVGGFMGELLGAGLEEARDLPRLGACLLPGVAAGWAGVLAADMSLLTIKVMREG